MTILREPNSFEKPSPLPADDDPELLRLENNLIDAQLWRRDAEVEAETADRNRLRATIAEMVAADALKRARRRRRRG